MNKLLYIVGLGLVVCLLSACGKSHQSPRIVCDLNGNIVPTAFTFEEFRQTLAREHGQVEVTGYEQLKTGSLVISFKPLENGTLLAKRVLVLRSGTLVPPAILFGITNAVQTTFPSVIEMETNAPATLP